MTATTTSATQTINEQIAAYEQGLRELTNVAIDHVQLKKTAKVLKNETFQMGNEILRPLEKERLEKQIIFEKKV
jgi:hypothetical protein